MKNQSNSWNEALDIIIESVLKPDFILRHYAKEEHCYDELMSIRDSTVEYLQTLRK